MIAFIALAGTPACKPHRLADFRVAPAQHDALAADILREARVSSASG